MPSVRGPDLLYILPLLAALVLGLSTMVQTGGEPVRSALVLGGPTDSDSPFRGRVQAKAESHGVPTSLAGEDLVVEASQSGHRVERKVRTDASGWAEFELPLKASPQFHLVVTDQAGHVLAEGDPALETTRWALSAKRRGGKAPRHEQGPLAARIAIKDRILAVPFETQGEIAVWYEGRPASGVQLELRGAGIVLTTAASGHTNESGRFPFSARPEEHVASLDVTIKHEGESLRFDQLLPVVPGAFGLIRDQGGFFVIAPVPREEAWFTFVRENERLHGGRILLQGTERGQSTGRIPEEAVPKAEGLYLVLASSADGRSPSTVGYPLDGQAQTFDAWDAYLIDGAPRARKLAEIKRRKIRWTLGGYVGIVGLLTLILFVVTVRRADRQLRESMRQVGATRTSSDESPLPLLIAVVCLFFAFSAGVLWIVAR